MCAEIPMLRCAFLVSVPIHRWCCVCDDGSRSCSGLGKRGAVRRTRDKSDRELRVADQKEEATMLLRIFWWVLFFVGRM